MDNILSSHLLKNVQPRRITRLQGLRGWLARRGGWVWLAALLVILLNTLPLLYLVLRITGAGTQAFQILLSTSTLAILGRSLLLAAAVPLSGALIAVPLAWITVRSDIPGRRIWAALAALPLVIPSYVGAYLFVAALGPRGMLARTLEPLGVERLPALYGFPGALLVLTLMTYPFIYLSVRAAMLGLDPSSEEAARSLGAGPLRVFWRVTLPQLRPALAMGSLLSALYVLRDFGAVAMLRYDTFTRVIYQQYRSSFDRSGAAVLAGGLLALTLFIAAMEMRTRSKAAYFRSAGGGRQAKPIHLGRWRIPALLFTSGVAGLSLVLPVGVLLYWLARGLAAGQSFTVLGPALWNSLLAAALAAGLTTLAALPIAWLAARRAGRSSRIFEGLAYIGYALPGIVIALALVFFGTRFLLPLYGSLALLLVAYLILFLPQATGALRTALLQAPPTLEDAARSLGKHPGQVFYRITLPLIRPGLLSGAALVFLTAMKELPATLILSPFGFPTLATAVWSAVSEAYFAQAALPALLLVLVSALPLAILTRQENH